MYNKRGRKGIPTDSKKSPTNLKPSKMKATENKVRATGVSVLNDLIEVGTENTVFFGIDPNDFYSITIWKNQKIQLQGDHKRAIVAKIKATIKTDLVTAISDGGFLQFEFKYTDGIYVEITLT